MYAYGKMQINDANWGQWKMLQFDTPESEFEAVIDEDLFNRINNVQSACSSTFLVIHFAFILVTYVSLFPYFNLFILACPYVTNRDKLSTP